MDEAATRRRPRQPFLARSSRRSSEAGPRLRPRGRSATRVRLPVASRRRFAVATTTFRPPSSAWHGCSTTRSGPTAVALPAVAEGFDCHAPRGRGARRDLAALSTSASRQLATCPSPSPGPSRGPAQGPRSLPARRDPRCARLPSPAQQLPRRRLLLRRAQCRRLLRHPEEVRGRLLAHHDVPRLPDRRRPVPLGVAVDDLGQLTHGAPLPRRILAPSCSSYATSRRTTSAPRRTCSSARPPTSRTQAIGPSRSRGSWRLRCRRTSSTTRRRSLSRPTAIDAGVLAARQPAPTAMGPTPCGVGPISDQ